MLVSIDLSISLNDFTVLVPKGFLKQGPIFFFLNQIDKWIAVAVEIIAVWAIGLETSHIAI